MLSTNHAQTQCFFIYLIEGKHARMSLYASIQGVMVMKVVLHQWCCHLCYVMLCKLQVYE